MSVLKNIHADCIAQACDVRTTIEKKKKHVYMNSNGWITAYIRMSMYTNDHSMDAYFHQYDGKKAL